MLLKDAQVALRQQKKMQDWSEEQYIYINADSE